MTFEKIYGKHLIGNNYYLNSLEDLKPRREEVEKSLNNIQYILDNYDNITPFDFYEHFKNFIEVNYERQEYNEQEYNKNELDIANLMYNTNYKKITKIKTTMVYDSYQREGHGRNLSWWYEHYQVCLYIATNEDINTEKVYSIKKIQNMINSGNMIVINDTSFRIYESDNISFKKEKYIEIKNTKEKVMSYENALGTVLKNKYSKKDLFNYFKEYLDEAREELGYYRAGYRDFSFYNCGYIDTKTCFEEAGYNKIYKLYKDKFKRKVNWE